MNIYETCPTFENDKYVVRPVADGDDKALLDVYGDEKATPFFNSDNCHGDDFHYTTLERMRQALDFWKQAYANGWFVRLAIADKNKGKAVGTIEAFLRVADDYFTDCVLLRLDLHSAYEKSEEIKSILSLTAQPLFALFGCGKIATKAIPSASERIKALTEFGFIKSDEPLIGHDGTKYYDYFVLDE